MFIRNIYLEHFNRGLILLRENRKKRRKYLRKYLTQQ